MRCPSRTRWGFHEPARERSLAGIVRPAAANDFVWTCPSHPAAGVNGGSIDSQFYGQAWDRVPRPLKSEPGHSFRSGIRENSVHHGTWHGTVTSSATARD